MSALRAACPAEVARLGFPAAYQNSILVLLDRSAPKGPTHRLVPFSILRGMPDMNCSLMEKIAHDVVRVKRMPVLEKSLFSCIAKHFFPDMGDAEVNELFGLRQHAVRQNLKALDESSLTENFEHADGVMDDKDADAIKDVVKRARAKLEAQLPASRARASLAGVVTEDRGHEIAKEYARLFIPPGATLNVDVRLHWRWLGEMPKREDPKKKHITASWVKSGDPSEAEALKSVLKTLWAWHCEDKRGSTCPHDFDSLFGMQV
jgi:hypothetical protein